MNVACPSCATEYPVDPRRVPPSGLNMRCPKCGARFQVQADGQTSALSAAPSPRRKPLSVPRPPGAKDAASDSVDLPAPMGAGVSRDRADEITAITRMLVSRARREDQVYILLGDMNIERGDGPIMQALRDSRMIVPKFPATNLSGSKLYDQMAFTDRGAASRKTRLVRHGVFDWRTSVFGPYPEDAFAALPDADKTGPTRRISHAEMMAHYDPICTAQRASVGKAPYADFARSYNLWTSFEMSDHLPIWIELETDYSDAYLARFLDDGGG